MSNWKFIVPESTVNLFTDPSFALADPDTQWTFAGDGTEDWTRSTAQSYYGFSSAIADLGGGTYADIKQTVTTTATSYTLSCMVRRSAGGVPTASHTRAYFDDAVSDWDSITPVGGGWYLCVKTATATAAANEFGVRALEAGLYVDGIQLENKAYRTTYCDGSREGCRWNGAESSSTSDRSAQSRAGGRVYDFEDDFGFKTVDWTGWGVPPTTIGLDSYALAPGAQVNAITTDVNVLTLVGHFAGSSMANLHSLRQALVEYLIHDRYPQTGEGWQPLRIWYTGAETWKEAKVFYDSGLEGGSMTQLAHSETIPIRFLMADPYWYEIGDSAAMIDERDRTIFRYVAGRLRSTGQWSTLGLTANPDSGGTAYAITYNPVNGLVYFGGDFVDLNNTGININRIASYNPATDTWALVGAGNAIADGIIYDIAIAGNGDVYIGGSFTAAGGSPGDYVAYYDISAGTWNAVSAGGTGTVYALAFDQSGALYIAGDFDNWNAIANADNIVKWDGSAYAAVGTGLNDTCRALALGLDNSLYAGGAFTSAGGNAAYRVAKWDGSAWSALGNGFSDVVYALAIHPKSSYLYAAGDFVTNQAATETYNYVAEWDGIQWQAMDGGVGGVCRSADFGPDGMLYVSGGFETVGSAALGIRANATWNGYSWGAPDIDLWVVTVYGFAACRADPVVPQNYDIYLGPSASQNYNYGGSAIVTNDGTAVQYPIITISFSAPGWGWLVSVRNETTGKQLRLYYEIIDGETLTIDCRPGKKSIVSSIFGSRPDAMLANSDFGSFTLQPGANQITCLLHPSGSGTTVAYMTWRDAYRGID